jgi:hypothetical protein
VTVVALDTEPRRPSLPVWRRDAEQAAEAVRLLDTMALPVARCIELSLRAGTADRWSTGEAAANPLTAEVAAAALDVTVAGFGARLATRWCALAGAADDANVAAALLSRCETRVPTSALDAALGLGRVDDGLLVVLLGSDRPNVGVLGRWLAGGYPKNQPSAVLADEVLAAMSDRARCQVVDAAFEWLALASCIPAADDPVTAQLWSTGGLPARWAAGPRCRPDVMTATLERLAADRHVGATAWRLALELADAFDGTFAELFDTAVLSER